MVKKFFAAFLLIVAGIFVAPLAANAAYVPSGTVSGSATAGGTVTASFGAGTFTPSETVHVTVDGAGTVTIGVFKAAVVSADRTASSNGALGVPITLPSSASGTYTVTATGATSGNTATATFTVQSASGSSSGAASGNGLADTGSTISILAIWIAAGLLLLGAAFITVRIVVRRQSRVNA
ncbi:MAG: hypothetical protein EPN48_06525 [Microbacteriaceae bacterium]|nr:MAG: hypothetical protein EPN48_06525 [Microbacteriaceae bacterium]